MFCPKCATQNVDGAKFCRACGVDISLVPQAMASASAAVAQPVQSAEYFERRDQHSFDKGLKSALTGLAFLIISIILSFQPMGRWWWYWMLVPAFTMLGGGIYGMLRPRQSANATLSSSGGPAREMPPVARPVELPTRNTGELIPQPPSVTEGTTRHLGAEAPTRHIGTHAENSGKDSL